MVRTMDCNAATVTQHRLEQQACMHGNITIVHAQTRHTLLPIGCTHFNKTRRSEADLDKLLFAGFMLSWLC